MGNGSLRPTPDADDVRISNLAQHFLRGPAAATTKPHELRPAVSEEELRSLGTSVLPSAAPDLVSEQRELVVSSNEMTDSEVQAELQRIMSTLSNKNRELINRHLRMGFGDTAMRMLAQYAEKYLEIKLDARLGLLRKRSVVNRSDAGSSSGVGANAKRCRIQDTRKLTTGPRRH
jgi:hypothetical protein